MLKYVLIIILSAAGSSEQMPEWYDTKKECETAGKAVETEGIVSYRCAPIIY